MKKTLAQRAIIYSAVIGNLTEEQCNQILASANYPKINSSSWEMLQRKYAPVFKNDLNLMGECIFKPRSIKDLPGAKPEDKDSPLPDELDLTDKKGWWDRMVGWLLGW